MLLTASPHIVTFEIGRVVMPMPEIMMSADLPLRVRGALTSEILRTSPLEMVRWVSMADWDMSRSRSIWVSLAGVRATGTWFSGVEVRVVGKALTSRAVEASFETLCYASEGASSCCAVEGDEGFGGCHCGGLEVWMKCVAV